jgi:hypothetical protein
MTDKETSTKEPEWTKGIKTETICQYFYVLFFIVAVYAGLILLADLYLVVKAPKVGWGATLRTLPVLAIAVANALFLYLLCARSLLK